MTHSLPESTVIVGHGVWFGMLLWQVLGYRTDGVDGMRACRRFQLGLPMPNCATFDLVYLGAKHWNVRTRLK